MRRWMFGVALASILVLPGQEVFAQVKAIAQVQIATTPMYVANNRLSVSDAVVLGRVVGLEPMDVETTPAPGQPKINYRIAVVQLTETLHGVQKDSKMVRVGFVTQAANFNPAGPGGIQVVPFPAGPNGRIMRQPFQPYGGGVQLQVGQNGLFQLVKHHKENFYFLANYNSFVSSENSNFQNEVQNAKHLCKVLRNTTASLKGSDAQERFLAAAILITKYRTHPGIAKLVPIDAEESKLILKALADSNWSQGRTSANIPTAMELFQQLGITVNDGYKQPVPIRNMQEVTQAMQKWLGENEGKYVIKKFVADPNAKAAVPPQPPVALPFQPNVALPPNVQPLPPVRIQPRVRVQPLPAPVPVAPNK